MIAAAVVVAAFAGAGMVAAAPNPTEPSSTSVFNEGTQCTIKWDADSTKTWSDMNIQLMTGDNWNMIPITTVAQNIDATTETSFTYPCPDVTPNSAIYFYQFSHKEDGKDLLWTTRFTIADAQGATTTPTETTQPDGQKIPWGKGALTDPSTAVPPPDYLGAAQTGGASSASGSATGTSAPVSSAAPTSSASSTSRVITSIVTLSQASSPTKGSASSTGTGTGTSSAASSTASANAAAGNVVPGVMAVVGALFVAVGMF